MHSVIASTFFLMLAVGLTIGKTPVDKAKILQHLKTYFDTVVDKSTRIPENSRKEIFKKYTDKKSMSRAPGVTLTQVAEVLISVQENAANIGNEERCDLENQELMDSLYASNWHDRSFKETFNHFVKLDNSGKKFCNFFAYLRCQHTTKFPGDRHHCLCPHHMTWKKNKCVFKVGEKCADISGLKGHDKVFPVFDYKEDDFKRYIPPDCEGSSTCRQGLSNRCEVEGRRGRAIRDTSLEDLSAFLRRHIEKISSDGIAVGSKGYEMLRHALQDIDLPAKQAFREALSLEFQIENQLLDYGEGPCNAAREAPIQALLDRYNSHDSPDAWEANGYSNPPEKDTLRIEYHKRVLQEGIKVCNGLKLLRCSSGECRSCKDDLVFDSTATLCSAQYSFRCGKNQMKLFKIQSDTDEVCTYDDGIAECEEKFLGLLDQKVLWDDPSRLSVRPSVGVFSCASTITHTAP